MSEVLALSIRGLVFRYGSGDWAVNVSEFSLPRGGQVLLTGSSGTGKSTLLNLVAGLLVPQAGEIRVAGRPVRATDGAACDRLRGEAIGMIFQTFNLLPGFTALENVMAAMMFSTIPRGEHRRRAAALLANLGIERPGAEPEKMSVGQQQRVAVARAVACDPVLVLADEPTASLDPENAAGAMDLIQQVCRDNGAALLCTSHDPAMKERFKVRASMQDLSAGMAVGF